MTVPNTQARRYAEEQAVQAVPQRLRPRRDPLEYQLRTLHTMATRAGCTDAAEWLQNQMKDKPWVPVKP